MTTPESPRLAICAVPLTMSTRQQHRVLLPRNESCFTLSAAFFIMSVTEAALELPATSSLACDIRALENSPASMPCSLHMYTPSATPMPNTRPVLL